MQPERGLRATHHAQDSEGTNNRIRGREERTTTRGQDNVDLTLIEVEEHHEHPSHEPLVR